MRSAKRALHAVIGEGTVTDEMLLTVMAEVEGLLNSRPLTHVSTDPDDYQALTPNHFLIGCASPNLPPPSSSRTATCAAEDAGGIHSAS